MEILKAVGLTANPPTTARPLFDWLFTIARSRRLLGISILVGLNVAEDVRNSSTNKIVVKHIRCYVTHLKIPNGVLTYKVNNISSSF